MVDRLSPILGSDQTGGAVTRGEPGANQSLHLTGPASWRTQHYGSPAGPAGDLHRSCLGATHLCAYAKGTSAHKTDTPTQFFETSGRHWSYRKALVVSYARLVVSLLHVGSIARLTPTKRARFRTRALR